MDYFPDIWRGLVGMFAPLFGFITSLQEQIEWHLRAGSLLIGILVGLLTIISLIKRLRKRS